MAFEGIVNDLRSVKIFHAIIDRINYTYLAEFFRFMGVLVCEEILVEMKEDNSDQNEIGHNTKYNAYICVAKKTLDSDEMQALNVSAVIYDGIISRLPEETLYLCDGYIISPDSDTGEEDKDIFSNGLIKDLPQATQRECMIKLLTGLFGKIYQDSGRGQVIAEQLQELVNIYVENRLWLHSMNLQYFQKRKSFAVAGAKDAFLRSHNEVKDLLDRKKDLPVNPWYQYAWLWCEWKVDTACDYKKDIPYFSVDKLVGRCSKLIEEYPEFDNAKVLLGLCYDSTPNRTNAALMAFEQAVKRMKDECFAAPVYYWMGRRYEAHPDMIKYTKHFYQLAAKSRMKFRTIFKLAVLARDEEDYDSTIRLFDEIISKLDLKLTMKFTDPLELEYLFKAYTQQSYVYNKTGQNKKAIEVADKATRIKEEYIKNNHYFEVFYGESADEYREVLSNRLDPKMAEWLRQNSEMKM